MGGVFAFAALAHAKTFHGFNQQHGGLTLMVHRLVVSRIHLLGVMATALQTPNVVVAHVGHHFECLGVLAKKVLPHVGAIVGFKSLIVAVYGVHHQLAQVAFFVARQQRLPVAAPQQLDNVPACASELAFKLLDDFAVATHRAVQTLQIAIDHKNKVVQILTGGQANRTQAFHFVHLAVATKHPHLAVFGVGNATRV